MFDQALTQTKQGTVVIIDDNPNIRESIKMILEEEYSLRFFESGITALEHIRNAQPDLVISDISMPQMNGIDVLRHIKEIDKSIQVIMLTGYASVESARASVRYGAYDYIVKPYDTEKLIEIVKSGIKYRKQLMDDQDNIDKIRKLNKEMEREMMKSRKLAYSGQLSAGIIHEVSNPLSAIEGYLHIIQKKIKDKALIEGEELDFLKKYIAITHNQLRRSIRIIRNHLDFLKISNEESLIDINENLEEIITLLKYQNITLNIEIKSEYGSIPKLRGNPDHFQQIFMNMLYNAIHAIEKRGIIIVRTEVVTEEKGLSFISISFIDSGHGIPKDKLEHIFEPFYSTKGKGKGTGLGMAISYEIIKKYGGDIIIKSTAGKGTKISLLIPLQ
ncbi:MAG: response regulator [Candidatus Aureabacteria bacterium]|nr:response regulator [Candidatus Auribacterota bacterium]